MAAFLSCSFLHEARGSPAVASHSAAPRQNRHREGKRENEPGLVFMPSRLLGEVCPSSPLLGEDSNPAVQQIMKRTTVSDKEPRSAATRGGSVDTPPSNRDLPLVPCMRSIQAGLQPVRGDGNGFGCGRSSRGGLALLGVICRSCTVPGPFFQRSFQLNPLRNARGTPRGFPTGLNRKGGKW